MLERLSHYDFDSDKSAWRDHCKSSPSDVPIYFKDWYWDAVCENSDDWHVVLVRDGSGISAAFPFVYSKRKGMYFIETPWQVPAAGIWFRQDYVPQNARGLKRIDDVVGRILELLPAYDKFDVVFDAQLWTWQPFYWRDFDCIPYYTMIVSGDKDVKASLAKKRRHLVNKTERECRVERNSLDADEYWDFFLKTYSARGRVPSYSKQKIATLLDALSSRGAMTTIAVYDGDNQLTAVNICLEDHVRHYFQFCTQMPDGDKGAQSLGTYTAICNAVAQGKVFDFEGSMIRGVCEFYSTFSPSWEVHYRIKGCSYRYRLMNGIRESFKAGRAMVEGAVHFGKNSLFRSRVQGNNGAADGSLRE